MTDSLATRTAAWIARSAASIASSVHAALAQQTVDSARFCADHDLAGAIHAAQQAQHSYVLALRFVAVANRGGAIPRAFKDQPITHGDPILCRQLRSQAFIYLNAARALCRAADRDLAEARAAFLAVAPAAIASLSDDAIPLAAD
jgi:hypothetical protein